MPTIFLAVSSGQHFLRFLSLALPQQPEPILIFQIVHNMHESTFLLHRKCRRLAYFLPLFLLLLLGLEVCHHSAASRASLCFGGWRSIRECNSTTIGDPRMTVHSHTHPVCNPNNTHYNYPNANWDECASRLTPRT